MFNKNDNNEYWIFARAREGIKARDGEDFNVLLGRFKNHTMKSGLLKDLKEREFFETKNQRRYKRSQYIKHVKKMLKFKQAKVNMLINQGRWKKGEVI